MNMLTVVVLVTLAQSEDAGVVVEPVNNDAGVVEVAPVAAPAPVAAAPVSPVVVVARPSARERRLGSLGFGFLGTTNVLQARFIAPGLGGTAQLFNTTTVPLLGLRWWTPEYRLGLEFGFGAMVTATDSSEPQAMVGATPTTLEFAWHASMPVVLGSTEHIIFFVAPEVRVGHSTWTVKNEMGTPPNGWTVEVSAKGGVEIFFSFIGLDNLSIEAGIRAGLTHQVRTNYASSPLQAEAPITNSLTRFSTNLVANPWDLFTSTLAARYYF